MYEYEGSTCATVEWRIAVAGTSFHQRDIKKAVRKLKFGFIEDVDVPGVRMWVVLRAEPRNKYDDLAVEVLIGKRQVGHVPAEDRAWAHAELEAAGGRPLYADAAVVRYEDDWERGPSLGVLLLETGDEFIADGEH